MILHHLNNPFANPKISEDNFGKIALTHLERLKTNNQEGQFTTLIEATQPLYDAYKEAVSDEAFEIALREGKTITVDAAIKGLKAKERGDDETVREAVRIAVRRGFRKSLDKNPVITVHLFRVNG